MDAGVTAGLLFEGDVVGLQSAHRWSAAGWMGKGDGWWLGLQRYRLRRCGGQLPDAVTGDVARRVDILRTTTYHHYVDELMGTSFVDQPYPG